jgi:single-stranded-DNA-specific exonuclease
VDAEVSFRDIRRSFYEIICQMEPFGPENLRPAFIARNVYNTGYSKIVKETHLRFSLKQDGAILTGIGFGMSDKMALLETNKPFDVVFKIDENEWKGEKILQLKIIDIKPSMSSIA